MHKKIVLIVSFIAIFGFLFNFGAPTAKAITAAEIQALIQQLQAQIVALQQQLTEVQETPVTWCHTFNTNLRVGDSGSEIIALHQALEKMGFGPFDRGEPENSAFDDFTEQTASAVVGFQEKYASEILTPWGLKHGTGFVGKSTRAKLNKLYGCQGGEEKQINYDAAPVSNIRLGQTYEFSAKVKGAPSNSTIYLYLQRPDGSFEYNGVSDNLLGSTDASGNWSRSITKTLENRGQTGTYVSWVMIGGITSNKIYHYVVGAGSPSTPSITVTYPNGGETWNRAEDYTITWKSSGVPKVQISLVDENSNRCMLAGGVLIPSGTINSYGFTLTTCLTTSGQTIDVTPGKYKIRITGEYDNSPVDFSDNYLTVAGSTDNPYVYSFNYTETDVYGGSVKFFWTTSGADSAEFQVNCQPGLTIKDAVTGADFLCGDVDRKLAANGSVYLKFTNTSGSQIYTNIFLTPVKNGIGNGAYSKGISLGIAPTTATPSITVLSPNGGEQWVRGKTYNIKWSSTGVDKVDVYTAKIDPLVACLSCMVGVYCPPCDSTLVAKNISASLGQYSWTIPLDIALGDKYKIRIGDPDFYLGYNNVYDQSDNYFSIAAATTTITFCDSYGDVNQDGSVTISDSLYISQYVAGTRTLTDEQKLRADVDQDGQITSTDSTMISEYLAKIRTSLPACSKTPPCGSYGDINGNSYVNRRDATLVANYLAGLTTLTQDQKTKADVDGNGTVSIADSLLIAQYAAGMRTTFTVCTAVGNIANVTPEIVYPTDRQVLSYGSPNWYMFKVKLITGATGYRYQFIQNGVAVYDNINNLSLDGEFNLQPSQTGYSLLREGDVTVKINAFAGSQSSATKIITIKLVQSSSITVTSPNGGEKWTSIDRVTDTLSGNESFMKYITWTGGSNPTPYSSVDARSVDAYLEQLINGQYVKIGRILPFAYGSIDWVVGVVSNSNCTYPDGVGNLPIPSDYCWLKTNMKVVSPGQYYVHLIDRTTKAEDRSDAPFSIVSVTTAKTCTELKVSQSYYFNLCAKEGYNFDNVCFDKFTGVYQGCTRNSYNDCTLYNTNAERNVLCPLTATTPSVTVTSISGSTSVIAGQSSSYSFSADDKTGASSLDFFIDWGDGTPGGEDCIAKSAVKETLSGVQTFTCTANHIFSKNGIFIMRVKASPVNVANWSSENTLTVKVSVSTTTPSITVISPNGGETWVVGNTYNITWKSTGVDTVNIILDKKLENSQQGDITLISNLTNDGADSWTVPSWIMTGQNEYKIFICSSSGCSSVGDSSDNWFSIVATTTTGKTSPCGSYGDINGDGYVTNDDATLISQYVALLTTLTDAQKTKADVNGDGTVTISDSLLIAQYAAGIRTTFAVCGLGAIENQMASMAETVSKLIEQMKNLIGR